MSKELFISSSPHETKVAVLEDDELVEVYHERDTGWALVGSIYKGRVTRVLPGMQSAFVDIGLERDAFLYVSDFFEDSEEYEKVVSEAEARVGRVTAAETTSPAAAGSASTESEPASLAVPAVSGGDGAPEDGAIDRTPPPPGPIEPQRVSSSSGEPEGPIPGATSSLRESQEIRADLEAAPGEADRVSEPAAQQSPITPSGPPFPAIQSGPQSAPPRPRPGDLPGYSEPRGRRRRRRGRGGFGDRKFTPRHEPRHPPQPTPPSAGSGEFEILPGESLAKYRQVASDPTQTAQSAAESGEGVSSRDASASNLQQPGFDQESNLQASLPEQPKGLSPGALESQEVPAWVESQAGSAAATGPSDEVGRTGAQAAGTPSIKGELEPAGPEAPPETAPTNWGPTTGQTPAAVSFETGEEISESSEPEPAAPKALLLNESQVEPEVPPEPEVAFESSPEVAPLIAEDQIAAAADTFPTIPEEHLENPSEPGVGSESDEAGASEERLEADASAVQGPEAQPPASERALSEQTASSEQSVPTERSYTLREPQQRRPRFAPRRGRRGRRGFDSGGVRPRRAPEITRSPGNNQPIQISELLKEGQEILVQIAKEPLGNKGARITSHVALPGRYLVYMPTIHHIGVSRKIGSEEERLRLRNIILENRGPLTGGFIVRTAGQGRSEEEFRADLRFLTTLWNEIRAKFERVRAPAILHRDLDLTQRILRDILSPDFKRVRVDNEVEYERIVDFVSRCQPALLGQVKLYDGNTPMFEEFGVQAEIDKALKPKVWLKSGGFIVINQTEALVAIDVNTGKYVGKTNRLEDTIVRTNIDAVKEIVRQVRLRDLGGIIVIDFIDMDERRNRQKVVLALEEALRRDRAPTNILSINEFGLVALTRKRVKQSLERTLCEPCPYCSGSGWVKSVNTVCYEILSEARKMANEIAGKVINLRVNPEVARALKSREGVLLSELESITRKDVIVRSDATVQQERFEIY